MMPGNSPTARMPPRDTNGDMGSTNSLLSTEGVDNDIHNTNSHSEMDCLKVKQIIQRLKSESKV